MDGPFIWAKPLSRYAWGTSDVDVTVPLPTLPLAGLAITLDLKLTTANNPDNIQNFLGAIKALQFRYRGTQIFALNGLDLYRIGRVVALRSSIMERGSSAANSRRLVTIWLPFGRKWASPDECFPKVDKGSTELILSMKGVPTGYNTGVLTVETLQLPAAQPKGFLRVTTINATPAATGNADYDLPRSAPILGIGLSQTNSEPGATTADIEDLKILSQFQDYGYSLASANALRALQYLHRGPGIDAYDHEHVENAAASYTQNATTNAAFTYVSGMSEFLYMDFDPLRDSSMALDGRQFNDLKLRVNFNAANAIRILPVELWSPDNLTGLPA